MYATLRYDTRWQASKQASKQAIGLQGSVSVCAAAASKAKWQCRVSSVGAGIIFVQASLAACESSIETDDALYRPNMHTTNTYIHTDTRSTAGSANSSLPSASNAVSAPTQHPPPSVDLSSHAATCRDASISFLLSLVLLHAACRQTAVSSCLCTLHSLGCVSILV